MSPWRVRRCCRIADKNDVPFPVFGLFYTYTRTLTRPPPTLRTDHRAIIDTIDYQRAWLATSLLKRPTWLTRIDFASVSSRIFRRTMFFEHVSRCDTAKLLVYLIFGINSWRYPGEPLYVWVSEALLAVGLGNANIGSILLFLCKGPYLGFEYVISF